MHSNVWIYFLYFGSYERCAFVVCLHSRFGRFCHIMASAAPECGCGHTLNDSTERFRWTIYWAIHWAIYWVIRWTIHWAIRWTTHRFQPTCPNITSHLNTFVVWFLFCLLIFILFWCSNSIPDSIPDSILDSIADSIPNSIQQPVLLWESPCIVWLNSFAG